MDNYKHYYIGLIVNSFDWDTYFSTAPFVLFFGLYSEIQNNRMPNKVEGATDYLTIVDSTPGSETYQCPNTSDYITADEDSVWFYTNDNLRTVSTSDLINYDFTRTFVKYSNDSPNDVIAILILKGGETLTSTEEDSVIEYFLTNFNWDNNTDSLGVIKSVRFRYEPWVQSVEYDAASIALFAAMSPPPDDEHKEYYDTFIKSWKAAGLWNKTEYMLILAAPAPVENAMIWINNPAKTATKGGGTFTPYVGYKGNDVDGGRINAGWRGETATNITKDSVSVMVYNRLNKQSSITIMSCSDGIGSITMPLLRNTSNALRIILCDLSTQVASTITDATGLFIATRRGDDKRVYRNGLHIGTATAASTAVPLGVDMFLGRASYDYSFFAMTESLDDTEITAATTIVEAYMDSLGIGVI